MSRAEEFQNSHKQLYEVDSYPIEVVKELERNAYIAGEKNTIERAVDWLKTRTFMFDSTEQIDLFIDLFRQAMEEEQ